MARLTTSREHLGVVGLKLLCHPQSCSTKRTSLGSDSDDDDDYIMPVNLPPIHPNDFLQTEEDGKWIIKHENLHYEILSFLSKTLWKDEEYKLDIFRTESGYEKLGNKMNKDFTMYHGQKFYKTKSEILNIIKNNPNYKFAITREIVNNENKYYNK